MDVSISIKGEKISFQVKIPKVMDVNTAIVISNKIKQICAMIDENRTRLNYGRNNIPGQLLKKTSRMKWDKENSKLFLDDYKTLTLKEMQKKYNLTQMSIDVMKYRLARRWHL